MCVFKNYYCWKNAFLCLVLQGRAGSWHFDHGEEEGIVAIQDKEELGLSDHKIDEEDPGQTFNNTINNDLCSIEQ